MGSRGIEFGKLDVIFLFRRERSVLGVLELAFFIRWFVGVIFM